MPDGTIAYVNKLPKCDFPHELEVPNAEYDFRTTDGRWGNGCLAHYNIHRMHKELGTGKGQKLIARPDAVSEVKQNHE